MTAPGARLGEIIESRSDADIARAVSRREKLYIWLLVGAWAIIPGVRRVVEWQIGSHSLAIINLFPTILMLPLFWKLLRKHRFGAQMNFVVGAWVLSLSYGFYISFVSRNLESGTYDLALFLVPMFGGLWAINASLNRRELFEVLASASLTFATIISLYGLYQYAAPPPWDVAWMNYANLVSVGVPQPFQLKMFGTLNSPATLAMFLVFAMISSLHRLSWQRRWLLLPLTICLCALLLTFVRAGYLGFALGVGAYFFCCSNRGQLLAMGSALAGLVVLMSAFGLSVLYGSNSSTVNDTLTTRVSSFEDVGNDESALDRERQTEEALRNAKDEPLGQGLGTVGTAAALSSASQTLVLDNGYMSRWLELGAVGFPAYLIAVFSALIFTTRRWMNARACRAGPQVIDMLATSIAVQIALIGTEITGDVHDQVSGLYFWLLVGLSLKGAMADARLRIPWSLKGRALGYATSGETA